MAKHSVRNSTETTIAAADLIAGNNALKPALAAVPAPYEPSIGERFTAARQARAVERSIAKTAKAARKPEGNVLELHPDAASVKLRRIGKKVSTVGGGVLTATAAVGGVLATRRSAETVSLIKAADRSSKAANAIARAANAGNEIAETVAPTDFWSTIFATTQQAKFRNNVHTAAAAVTIVAKVAQIAAKAAK